MIYDKIQLIKDKIYGREFWVYLGNCFWSLGLIYLSLYFLFEIFAQDWYQTTLRKVAFESFAKQQIGYSSLFSSAGKFIIPAILLLLIFIVFAVIFLKIKKRNIFFVLLNAYFPIVIFTFLTIKIDWLLNKNISFFEKISWGEILAFMMVYGLPIVVSFILKEKQKKDYLIDTIFYFLLFILIVIFYFLKTPATVLNVVYLLYSVGLLYYISSMVALLSFLDLSSSFENSVFGNLLYLILPVFLMISYFTVANLLFFEFFVKIFMVKEVIINVFAPIEHFYFYLSDLINYQVWLDFAYGLLSISAIVVIVMTVYKKMEYYVENESFWRYLRAIVGFGFLGYFMVKGFL